MKSFTSKVLQLLLCFAITTVGLCADTFKAAIVFDPMTTNYFAIYHANDSLIWDGDRNSPFYHENGEIAWLGPKKSKRDFLYDNGVTAWKGYLGKDITISYDTSSVFHENGELAWAGASYKQTNFEKYCAVYHDNGEKAWAGGIYADTKLTYSPCSVYYNNGTLVWKGATKADTSSLDATTVYHSDGSVAWRGQYAKDKAKEYACGVFYANGQLAWNGKSGSPMYDIDGSIISKVVADIQMPLGNNSFLYVYASGQSYLSVNIGGYNYLLFSSEHKPVLSANLGVGYHLNFFPREGIPPELEVYDAFFIVDYSKK